MDHCMLAFHLLAFQNEQITRRSHGSLHVGISLAVGPHRSHPVVSIFLHDKKIFPQLFFRIATAQFAGPTTPGVAPLTRRLHQMVQSAMTLNRRESELAWHIDGVVEELRSTGASVGSLFAVEHHTKANRVKASRPNIQHFQYIFANLQNSLWKAVAGCHA